jgi:hypothetical protein
MDRCSLKPGLTYNAIYNEKSFLSVLCGQVEPTCGVRSSVGKNNHEEFKTLALEVVDGPCGSIIMNIL